MAGLMISDNRGGRQCTLEDVCAVPVPVATDSYNPIPNGDLIQMLKEAVKRVYNVGEGDMNLSLALSGKDQQMFGSLTVGSKALTSDRFKSSTTIVFRSSYNKSLSVTFAGGAHSWVCSNLQISGEIVELRRHTTDIWTDILALIERVVRGARGNFENSMATAKSLSGIKMSYDESCRLIGLAQGHKVLRPQQASVVLQELEMPSHEEFRPETAWSLYNHFTEGLKRGRACEALARHHRATQFFDRQLLS